MSIVMADQPPSRDLHAKARYNMVESQIRPNRVTDPGLLAAFSEIPREIFAPAPLGGVAYVDKSLRVAPGRYMMEPLFLGRLLQEAVVGPEDTVLVIGAGTGYSTAILSHLAARVTGLESDAELAAKARTALVGLGLTNVGIETGALLEGWLSAAPYDVILIDGAVAVAPDRILGQLAERGRLVTIKSEDGRSGAGMLYRKIAGAVSGRVLFDAVVPFLPGFEPASVFAF